MSFPGGNRKALHGPYHQRERREYSVFPRLSPTRHQPAYQDCEKDSHKRTKLSSEENSFPLTNLRAASAWRFPQGFVPSRLDQMQFVLLSIQIIRINPHRPLHGVGKRFLSISNSLQIRIFDPLLVPSPVESVANLPITKPRSSLPKSASSCILKPCKPFR